MADPPQGKKTLRVLLSEGSSTSAREVVTVLGLAGHIVEICDPSAYCLGRFSRFVSRFHRCPGLRDDPAGYLEFVEKLVPERHIDVVLPVHEQGFVFARVGARLGAKVGLALPDFESYRMAHSKAGFSRLLDELGLPQPATRVVASAAELRDAVRFPCMVKQSIGTASRGVWLVRDETGLTRALRELAAHDAFAGEVLVQDLVAGATEKAQAIFSRGHMLGFHVYRRIAAGAGGGEAIKQSVHRPRVRADVAAIGRRLGWHGALSVDLIMPEQGAHRFIDCNPRLVEPMSAELAGLGLVDLLLRVSRGETPAAAADARMGVRTHLAIQALLGRAQQGATRRGIFRELTQMAARRGAYAASVEELTPVRHDWISAVPLAMTAMALLVDPRLAATLAEKGWGAHLLGSRSIRLIEGENFP